MKAEPEKLIDLMFDNKRQYQIPVYQRNYDWKKDNCLELFNDVVTAYDNETTHFLGTIVQVQQEEEGGIKRFIIIDGQQRMTSIYLLLKALYDHCTNGSAKEELEALLFNNSSSREFNKDEKSKLKLKPIKSDNEQFVLLMANKFELMDKSSNIYVNYEYFSELLEKSVMDGKEIKNIKKGLEYLEIVMISLKEPDDDPQVIFERINSTGEDLKLADLIRNYLLMTDSRMEELYEDYWLPVETLIGRDNINDYFSNYLVFALPESNEKNAYQQFKKYADVKSHEDILKSLKKYSKYYNAFIREDDNFSDSINYYLAGYRSLKQSTIFPFFFSIFSDFDDNLINEDELCQILQFFLNYTLRRVVCGIPSNSLRGLYKTLYKRIFNKDEKKNDYLNSIYNFMATIPSTKDVVPNDTTFKDRLMNENIYKNSSACKFILGILENGFIGMKETVTISSKITIEHILPQNKDNLDWQDEIGENYQVVYERYINTLGNLTLTGYNSELSDSPFSNKVELLNTYTKFSILNFDVVNKKHWNEDAIKERAARLSDKLVGDLKLPLNFKIASKQQTKESHTLIDGADLSGTKPTYFIFMGERREVSTYADVLIKTLEIFEELDSKKFSELAKINFKMPNGEKPCISYDRNLLRSYKEINNAGIYIETNHSANTIIKVLKLFFDEFSFDYDEFIFSVETK